MLPVAHALWRVLCVNTDGDGGEGDKNMTFPPLTSDIKFLLHSGIQIMLSQILEYHDSMRFI